MCNDISELCVETPPEREDTCNAFPRTQLRETGVLCQLRLAVDIDSINCVRPVRTHTVRSRRAVFLGNGE